MWCGDGVVGACWLGLVGVGSPTEPEELRLVECIGSLPTATQCVYKAYLADQTCGQLHAGEGRVGGWVGRGAARVGGSGRMALYAVGGSGRQWTGHWAIDWWQLPRVPRECTRTSSFSAAKVRESRPNGFSTST